MAIEVSFCFAFREIIVSMFTAAQREYFDLPWNPEHLRVCKSHLRPRHDHNYVCPNYYVRIGTVASRSRGKKPCKCMMDNVIATRMEQNVRLLLSWYYAS